MVSNVVALHRQNHLARSRHALVHFEQERRNSFEGGPASQKQYVVFSMLKVSCHQTKQLARETGSFFRSARRRTN